MPDIVTVTMNPALDMTTYTEQVRPTSKLRCEAPRLEAGGGGINVAKVAGVLGVSAAAVYPAGGPTGDMLSALLSGGGVDSRRIDIDGMTRESFTAIERSTGQEYRFVLPGPELSVRDQERCLDMLVETATGARYVVASGSLPPGVPGEFVQRVADAATDAGARFVLDSSGGRAAPHQVRCAPGQTEPAGAARVGGPGTAHPARTGRGRPRARRRRHRRGRGGLARAGRGAAGLRRHDRAGESAGRARAQRRRRGRQHGRRTGRRLAAGGGRCATPWHWASPPARRRCSPRAARFAGARTSNGSTSSRASGDTRSSPSSGRCRAGRRVRSPGVVSARAGRGPERSAARPAPPCAGSVRPRPA